MRDYIVVTAGDYMDATADHQKTYPGAFPSIICVRPHARRDYNGLSAIHGGPIVYVDRAVEAAALVKQKLQDGQIQEVVAVIGNSKRPARALALLKVPHRVL